MSDEPTSQKSDIDFDELDKAVNSLMGKVGSETLDDADKTKTLDINTTLKADDKVHYDAIGKAAEKIGDESLTNDNSVVELDEDLTKLPDEMQLPVSEPVSAAEISAPALVTTPTPEKPAIKRPSSGRFMDVVSSKADMRSAAPSRLTQNRIGTTIQPFSAITPDAASDTDTPPDVPAPDVPLTPFLPDANVEKRPLGGGMPSAVDTRNDEITGTDIPTETNLFDENPDKSVDNGGDDDQRPLDASAFEKESTTELELTKIESEETSVDEPLTIEKVESGDTENLKNPDKATREHAAQITGSRIGNADGAIYDTKNYHQPINHPPKQKSGWGRVVIILLIILLAVAIAGGAYLYFGTE